MMSAAPVLMSAECRGCGREIQTAVPDSRETSFRNRSRIRCAECGTVSRCRRDDAGPDWDRNPDWFVSQPEQAIHFTYGDADE